MSTSVQQISSAPITVERRFYPRVSPNAPIFLAFDERDETLLLNISENGLLVSTPKELIRDSVARLSISLSGMAKPVQVHVRVLWTNEVRKLAGIQLLDLCEHDRERIRKWAARESAQTSHPNRTQSALFAQSSPAIPDSPQATRFSTEEIPSADIPETVAVASPAPIRMRKASVAERCVIAGLYLAAAALVAVFFFRYEAMGNPFTRLKGNSSPIAASSIQPPLADAQRSLPVQNSAASTVNATLPAKSVAAENLVPAGSTGTKTQTQNFPVQSTLPNSSKAKTNRTLVGTRPSSAESQNAKADSSESTDASAATDADSEESSALPQFSEPAGTSNEAHDISSSDATTRASALSVSKSFPSSPTNSGSVAAAASAAAPPSTPVAPHLSSMVAPARPTLSSNSALNVIQMDPLRNQTLEVHLSSGYQSSFFGLPGQRVLETPAITMSIQRSVLMPSTRSGWFAGHNKTVVVGELISRADPQPAQISSTATISVRVQAIVAKDGHIENIRLVSGPQNLVPAVTRALREWRYQPTLVDDKPVKTQSDVIFQFHASTYRASKH